MALHVSGRANGAVAVLLSSLLPGLGQLYNRQWVKGGIMLAGSLALGLAVKEATGSVFQALAAATGGVAFQQGPDLQVQLLRLAPAMADPAVQASIRRGLLPALLGLTVLAILSMLDAYRHGRSVPSER